MGIEEWYRNLCIFLQNTKIKVKRTIRTTLGNFSAIKFLENNTTDFDICNRDWPRQLFFPIMTNSRLPAEYRYTVRAVHFWYYGTGIGRTPMQAARRAVRNLDNKIKRSRLSDNEIIQKLIESI